VVNVTVEAINPEVAGAGAWNIPLFLGFAAQSVNPGCPNGSLIFTSVGEQLTGKYGIQIWYAE
jgi:hypothetical protein